MGAEQSAEHAAAITGFHVLHVSNHSPAFEAGLSPYFDFIVSVNDRFLTEADDLILADQIQQHLGQAIKLGVYSSKERSLREIQIVPRTGWTDQPHSGALGCTVRFCDAKSVEANVWHILNVSPDSPAFAAGLQSFDDYIVGTPETAFVNEMDFSYMVASHVDKPMQLLVYNTKSGSCRQITITPQRNWGGEGLLGCDIGFGYLHRIPKSNPTPSVTLPPMESTTLAN
ncbi:hypothetical protein H4R33_001870 [Dimargaris cristalligena]|uniref:GRASP55/65 PDZ-like domain-containing protein n=1 Tax=Dimargaris cristalligena TaxID=215637 RepID=A0A4Q0A2S9_9FUNG|nr:hypothetical protein H4R33_001870 [Dimargaris cristalligena]RKP40446.1 GRASP55/65 PDZ-like domain-containing protein [Dimargaris cristalligena]|eukprot:RKP40446.1 GRASP55/65 PDZ-like domain-containing protein [Dimargaris cristalligena]